MRQEPVPYAIVNPEEEGLNYLGLEISYGTHWVDLNDHQRYRLNAQNSRDSTTKSWRKITATSPVLGGEYLVHATPGMITETVSIWVHGNSQTDLSDNFFHVEGLFEQMQFQIRWTLNEYREYWRCQLAEASSSRGQVFTHSQMALISFSVPRFPDVYRERIG